MINKLSKLIPESEKWINTLLCSGVLYILIYTPIWGVAWTGIIAGLVILLSWKQGILKTSFISYRYFILAILAFIVFNITFSQLPIKATTGAVSVLKGLLLYPAALFAGRTMSENHFNSLGIVFLLVNSLFLLILLFWVVNWDSSYSSLNLWSEKYLGNLHNLDNLIFISNLLALTLLLKVKALKGKFIAASCLSLSLFVSILVESEGSTFAMGVCGLVLMGLYSIGLWRGIFVGLSLLLIILLHSFYFNPDLFVQLTGHESRTMMIRSEIYQQLLLAWQEHPWMGWGFNTYKYVAETSVNGQTFLYPHHIYLEGLFSLGILGCSLCIVWISSAVQKVDFANIRQSAISLFSILALIYISIKGMSDMKLLSQQTIGWIAICFGLLHGQAQLTRQK